MAYRLRSGLPIASHRGFPEQASQWDWIEEQIRTAGRPLKVINLFGYTGMATAAAARAGAEVTHVDASKHAVSWASRNIEHSGLAKRPSAGWWKMPANIYNGKPNGNPIMTASSSTHRSLAAGRMAGSGATLKTLPICSIFAVMYSPASPASSA